MSLTSGLHSPRTPMRRFLDRELSAGPRRVRATYRARLPLTPLLLPGDGVGFEAGTVGTAIDQQLRLAFTCVSPLDGATLAGLELCHEAARRGGGGSVWPALADTGWQLAQELPAFAGALALDTRGGPLTRAQDEEEYLARMLLCAAWYALKYRNGFAFPDTPLYQAASQGPHGFTFERMLAVPTQALVDDVLAQLHGAEGGPLDDLRGRTTPPQCVPGPTFDGSADVAAAADLIADGILIDFKSTPNVHAFPIGTVQQLLGYTLLDYTDRYKIDTVGVYLTRARALIPWPLEDYLALLGIRRRDLTQLRKVFALLLGQPEWAADCDPLPDQREDVDRVLAELAAVIPDGYCRVCAQPFLPAAHRRRLYCSTWCATRAPTLRRRGWMA